MIKAVRRIVAGNDSSGKAVALSDGPSEDVIIDPARPGFASTRLWVTDSTPAKTRGVCETLHLPHQIEPPRHGSVFRYYEVPPESSYISKINETDVQNYFALMGSPDALVDTAEKQHPYMQQTDSLDFCYILEGEITLVLEAEEVHLKEGDTVIQRATRHAWSNRSDKPCIIVMSSHDAMKSD